ncbi:unnamed protein product, partial [Mesorhabditis belari]|uniref:F-box domain-containing protein n=1 Tax=Mesorhabditis belari TaxID=2138241 RepID=A0AAF3F459_9BILA
MGIGSFECLPVEILTKICDHCDLEDVLALQSTHIELEMRIRKNFFSRFEMAKVTWMENASIIAMKGNDLNEQEITTNRTQWEQVIRQTKRIHSLHLEKTDAAYKKAVIVAIAHNWKLSNLEIVLKPSSKEISPAYTCKNYTRLTRFVESQKASLKRLTLRSSPVSRIELRRTNDGAHIEYGQERNIFLHHQLINPLFRAMLAGGSPVSSLDLSVDGCEQLEYSLQNAFQAALPYDQRSALRSLRIHFGPEVSSLSHAEMDRVLTTYAPTLHVTPNLTHILCDLTHCSVEPESLEGIFKAISRELRGSHRISLVTPNFDPTIQKQMDFRDLVTFFD